MKAPIRYLYVVYATRAQDSLIQVKIMLLLKVNNGNMCLSCTGNAEAPAGEAGAGPSSSNNNQAAPSAAAAEEEGDNIDPEFLAALPPEIQAEVLEQQRRERRMRQRQRQQQEAAAAAAAQVSSMHTVILLIVQTLCPSFAVCWFCFGVCMLCTVRVQV